MGVPRHLLEGTVGSTGNRTSDTELTQANFDTNMVIILAALLCALICALGLNSMVRCVLRCTRGFGVDSVRNRTGLKKSALKKIPVIVHGPDHGELGSGSGLGPEAECPICLGEFVNGEKVRVLPKCNHAFHVRCIDTWLGSHSSCPNCRHSLLEAFTTSKGMTRASDGSSGGAPLSEPRHDSDNGVREGHVVVEVNVGGS